MPKKYKTAVALRHAIEDRLAKIAGQEKVSVERLRRHVAFERLLSRIFSYPHSLWILKGGYAMELRLKRARATKDVDLAMSEGILASLKAEEVWDSVFDHLVKALAIDLDDFFTFEIRKKPASLFAPPFGGMRFFVDAILGTRLFARFQIDIGAGDIELLPTEVLKSKNLLSFAGFDCPLFPAISKEQQFAEKLHAYTKIRKGRMGTRIKDLIDMVLLIQEGSMKTAKVLEALHMTFNKRNTHPLPSELPVPPQEWLKRFDSLTTECQLVITLADAFELTNAYYSSLKM